MRDATSGGANTAIGSQAGLTMSGGSAAYNIVIGHQAGDNISSGAGNIVIGSADVDSATGNRQLVIAGNDGSSTTTWISGDSAGALTFADKVVLAANKTIEFGDSGETISGDGTNLSIVSSNSLGIDTANGITLDSGSGGAILKAGGSTTYGTLTSSSGDFSINQTTSDKDIIFTGNDGGSTITALTLDMSEAGAATFNAGATFGQKITVSNGTSQSNFDTSSNVAALRTRAGGVEGVAIGAEGGVGHAIINMRGQTALVGGNSSKGLSIGLGSSHSTVPASTGSINLNGNVGIGTGSSDPAQKLDIKGGSIAVEDNQALRFGDGDELIKGDGSKLIIVSGGTTFNLPTADGDADQVLTTDGSGTLSFADAGGASSGFSESTITTLPGQEGNFDLAKTNNAGSAETGLTAGGTDSFGVALGSVYTMMEPVGASTTNNTDLGSSESHVGA